MAFFEFTSDLETGISRIDLQHRALVNILNNIAEVVHSDMDGKDFAIKINVEQLIDYTIYHFQTEEMMMDQCHYEHIASHREAHQKLSKTAKSFQDRMDNGETELGQELLEFLKLWLTEHIKKTDMAYVSKMKESNIEIDVARK